MTSKKGDEGLIDLCYLDEAGFAMTQPTTYSWYFMKERLVIPYEAPQGRRLNVIGAYFSHGPCAGRFEFESLASLPKSRAKTPRISMEELAEKNGLTLSGIGTLDADFFLSFVWKIAGRPCNALPDWKRERPLYVTLDNYSVHKGEVVRSALEALEVANIHLFYLPSYSPELSKIEPIWRAVKYREMTTRSYTVLGELKQGVEDALARKAEQLLLAARTREPSDPLQTLPTQEAHPSATDEWTVDAIGNSSVGQTGETLLTPHTTSTHLLCKAA